MSHGRQVDEVFPFIVGSGRSGTTLMRVMLNAHRDLAIAPEAFFPYDPAPEWLGPDDAVDVDAAMAGLQRQAWFSDWELEPHELPTVAPTATYPDVLRTLFAAYARKQGKPRYGSKTPQHVLAIERLARLFPDARFVHVVRDGRDVAASFLEVHFGPSDIATAARLWRHRVEKGRAAGQALGPDRYLECRYERLLEDPEEELRRVCAFIALPYDGELLRYHERRPTEVAGIGDRYYHRHLAEPPTPGLRDWRTQMDRSDVLLFESIAGPSLSSFGYERATIEPTLVERLGVGLRRTGAEVHRRGQAVRRRGGRLRRRLQRA